MEKVAVDGVEPSDLNPALRALTGELGATALALNYDLDPGALVSGGYHTHHDQEEMFYVVSGTVTFETGEPRSGPREDGGTASEDDDLLLSGGVAIRFAPGEFHHAYNAADDPAVVLAVGAPAYGSEVESVRECTECGEVFHHRRPSVLGAEDGDSRSRIPAVECPRCGGETRRTGRPDD